MAVIGQSVKIIDGGRLGVVHFIYFHSEGDEPDHLRIRLDSDEDEFEFVNTLSTEVELGGLAEVVSLGCEACRCEVAEIDIFEEKCPRCGADIFR